MRRIRGNLVRCDSVVLEAPVSGRYTAALQPQFDHRPRYVCGCQPAKPTRTRPGRDAHADDAQVS